MLGVTLACGSYKKSITCFFSILLPSEVEVGVSVVSIIIGTLGSIGILYETDGEQTILTGWVEIIVAITVEEERSGIVVTRSRIEAQ
jgi:hypothetical protein